MAKTKEELLAARAARERERAEVAEKHELLVLELEDKFATELGREGVAWAMVNRSNQNEEGPVVVKLGDPTAHKLFASKSGATLEDQFAFVSPSVVYPDKVRWNEMAIKRPALLGHAVIALQELFGTNLEELKGKL